MLNPIADTSTTAVAASLPAGLLQDWGVEKPAPNQYFIAYENGTSEKMTVTEANGKTASRIERRLDSAGRWKMIGLIAVMVLFVTMVYGPIAAFLVELFPTRIRYTSMSLPYHIGNGVFGGLVPFIATLVTTLPGANHLSGLWYPIGIAFLSFVIGILYIRKSSAIKY